LFKIARLFDVKKRFCIREKGAMDNFRGEFYPQVDSLMD